MMEKEQVHMTQLIKETYKEHEENLKNLMDKLKVDIE